MEFASRVAMITGAAVGIGRATAILMAERGAKLVLIDVNGEGLDKLKQELAVYQTEVLTYVCDVSDENAIKSAVAQAQERLGAIDILVNNAALWRVWQPFVEMSSETWRKYFDVNVMGTVYCTQAVLPRMLERGWGRIVNVASVAGVYGNANMTNYSATKGALIAFTKALAKEVTDRGVLVNAVSPGSVSPSEDADIDAYIPSELAFIGRTGTDRENAELICFLSCDKASYISGQNIQIDGCRKKQ